MHESSSAGRGFSPLRRWCGGHDGRPAHPRGSSSTTPPKSLNCADAHTVDPATLAAWVQGHWGIENRVHWVRDVTFDDDRSQAAPDASPQVMATIRNTVIAILRLDKWPNLAHALRHHSHDLDRPVRTLLNA